MFTINDSDEYNEKINLDELYERKKQHDILTINNYNKILNRIHNKIKTTSRLQLSEQYCWFIVPEVMIGVPKYNLSLCVAYIIDKLEDNGFKVRYTYPNMLFISWSHWVPNYVREEIKKKTGVIVDGFGNIIKNKEKEQNPNDLNNLTNLIKYNNNKDNEHRDTKSYKPSGNLVYNEDLLDALKNPFK